MAHAYEALRRKQRAEEAREPSSAPQARPGVEQILAMQRGAGNQATVAALGGKQAGLNPEEQTDVNLGGATAGEAIGDMARPVGSFFGDALGGMAGLLGGNSINATTKIGPKFGDNGHFDWGIEWVTSGKSGWIVQEIVNEFRGEDKDGKALPSGITPQYWEAWPVDDKGKATPVDGRGNDDWIRSNRGAKTKGHWSMKGAVYWTDENPTKQGFKEGAVRNAGDLLATTTAPTGLGVARDHRYAQGTWDSTVEKPYHTGSAR
ncbi:hypothetical protein OJ998_01835 [Solirubrobacter taibaiensis]|nr:hypothetical protein [Solirubrobacter taibaiensis]